MDPLNILDMLEAPIVEDNFNDLFVNYDPKNAKTFEQHCTLISNWIKRSKKDYLKILGLKNFLEMTFYFALHNKEAGSVCAKEMIKVGGWRCMDCIKHESVIFCQECWSGMKEKHKGHNVVYINNVNGTCDCGDPNTISPTLFCPKHHGPMTTEQEIKAYLNASLGPASEAAIRNINLKVFDQMGQFVIRAFQEKKEESIKFVDQLSSFIEFFSFPCSVSRPILHIVTGLLLNVYPFKTKHKCISFQGTQPKLVKSAIFSHNCCCPFIRLLLLYWPMGKANIITSFLHNYKLRKVLGFCYILLYGEFIKNCLLDLKDLSVQVLSDEVCREAIKLDGFVDNIYNCMPEIYRIFFRTSDSDILLKSSKIPLFKAISLLIKENKSINKYNIMKEIVLKLKLDTMYLAKSSTISYFGNNLNIYLRLIDLLAIVHNVNLIDADYLTFLNFIVKNSYVIQILDIELWTLDIFAFFVSIMNFDNNNLVKEVFSYFSKKINKKKRIIAPNEYTFHIALFRGFSIFLNRYCFHYAQKTGTDVYKGLESAIKIFPNYQNSFKIMLESIYKVFGFITGCSESLFSNHGPLMKEYEYLYYYNKQFIYRDFCLMKYIMALKQFKDYFKIDTILNLCKVKDSNEPLEKNILKGDKMKPPKAWLNDKAKTYMRFSAKILRIILNVLRNNTCLIWNLGSAQLMLRNNKIEDKLIKQIINNDTNNFTEIVNELIVNQTCIKENLALYTEIYDSIFLCFQEVFGKKKLGETILKMTNKTLTQDKKAKFSIKDEYLDYLDLNYILYPIHKSTIEKYIQDFKKDIVSIFNVHFYPVNKYEAKLTNEDYKQMYFEEQNFDFFFRFTAFIIQREDFKELNEFFIPVLLNYLGTFFCLENDQFLFFRDTIKNKIIDLVQILENNNLDDDMQKSYCHYIIEKIKENDNIDSNTSKFVEDEFTVIEKKPKRPKNIEKKLEEPKKPLNVVPVKSNKISMKEKMKNKFKKKNVDLGNKFGLDKIQIDKKKNIETCIICLKPIEDDFSKPYGKISDFLFDNFLSNTFFQVIKREYNKYYEKDLKLKSFHEIYFQPKERRNIRLISCNHYVHFSCHFKTFMESNLENSVNIFTCPLCHRLSQTFIPMLDHYTREQSQSVFCGFVLNEVYNFGKENLELFKLKMEYSMQEIRLKFTLTEKQKTEAKKPYKQFHDISFDVAKFKKDFPEMINACKHICEGFVCIKLFLDHIDLEGSFYRGLISTQYIFFSIQFRDFLDFMENIDDRKTTVNLWKNLELSMRLLLRINILEKEHYFCEFYNCLEQIKQLKFDSSLEVFIKNDTIKLKICELLFFISLLFDYEDIAGYEKYIIYMILPIFGFEFFYKDLYIKNHFSFNKINFIAELTEDKLYKYLKIEDSLKLPVNYIVKKLFLTKVLMKNDIDPDKITYDLNMMLDVLNLSELKNKTYFEIIQYLDKTVKISNEKIASMFKPYLDYKKIFKTLLDEHIPAVKDGKVDVILNPTLFGSCFPMVYKFIDLPPTAIDFEYQFYNVPCEGCSEKGKYALICLDCGRKVCDSRSCLTKKVDNIEMACFFAHTKLCGGGRSAFLQSEDLSVLFVSHRVVFQKFIPLYVNQFGEGITKSSFGEEFKLNKEEVQKALKMFTSYSYSNSKFTK